MSVDDVKGWMSFLGWTDGGAAGSVKYDAERRVVARHGGAQWIADVEDSCEKVKRQHIVQELERRDREAH